MNKPQEGRKSTSRDNRRFQRFSLRKATDLQALNEKRIDDLGDREPDIAIKLEACSPGTPMPATDLRYMSRGRARNISQGAKSNRGRV